MLKSFDELLELAVKKGPKKLAVAVAEDKEVLGAVGKAKKLGIADAILVGNSKKIEKVAEEIGLSRDIIKYRKKKYLPMIQDKLKDWIK